MVDCMAIQRGTVDCAADPRRFIGYLGTLGGLETIQQIKEWIFDLLDVRDGDCLLDVGCGTGDDVRCLARRVGATGRVVGVDATQSMVAEAQIRSQHEKLPVEFVCRGCRAAQTDNRHIRGLPRWETLIVDASNREITRKLLNFHCDRTGGRWIGGQLHRLFDEAGLTEIAVVADTGLWRLRPSGFRLPIPGDGRAGKRLGSRLVIRR
ncbi:MAG TPA: methyltransferase domain-containing protein [Pirellulales bacterium]|nr:methyltransferase domain-containing protein [Pirellulales bacterium]